jgi:hypothetical protein
MTLHRVTDARTPPGTSVHRLGQAQYAVCGHERVAVARLDGA